MDRFIKLAAIEIQETNSNEIIKVAGIVSRLKKWLRSKLDKEYNKQLSEANEDFAKIKETILKLHRETNIIQEAIKDGDIELYKASFEKLKELSFELIKEVKIQDRYSKDDLNNPFFKEKAEEKIFETGLKFQEYNQPLKSIPWFKSVDAMNVVITENSQNSLYKLLSNISKNVVKELILDENFLDNFRQAVVNGTLLTIKPLQPRKNETAQLGARQLLIETAPFEIGHLIFNAVVSLIDASTPSTKKLVLQRTLKTNILTKKEAALVKNNYTELSELDFAKVLAKGYKKTFGYNPSIETLGVVWAQCVLEAGLPIKLPNNNIGNIKTTSDWIRQGKPYFAKSTQDFTDEGVSFILPDATWKAFATPEEGAAAYWKLIGNRYSAALDWMKAGDPDSAAVALALKGYFTANIRKYSSGVNQLYKKFLKKIAPQMPEYKSNPLTILSQKPEIKDWVSQYSKQQKDLYLNPVKENKELPKAASLTNLVKTAMIKQVLPHTSNLIIVKGSDYIDKLEFARILSNLLIKVANSNTIINSNGEDVEISTNTLGNPLTVTKAIEALSDCVSCKMTNINTIVATNSFSNLEEVDERDIIKNQDLFQMRIL